ncbi:adenylate/guanylate cyclase domain-containing protein [Bradyrhizobium liaoningense]|uniref:adenylate/guanylate cyclase domain-containing protein n=1 Tax=Bradyrhizobium liaoningense TaxID=43992 RepID=UPI001BAC73F0|nr:adenylate/guanylate cyclase domain-containing protein [Bradyrhizobium liaoningense]MBR0740926.1 adenylate/guanylate cyclase domain-containing protein [Bradyrhizobium liaoningense]
MIASVPELRRRLAAILAADVVGYTRLMQAHEETTHARLMQLRSEVLDPGVTAQNGRIVKNTGDGFLATFDTARDAARCALSLQEAVATNTAGMPADERISFRIGLNAADIIVEKEDVYGDGVNIAARLQNYATAGGIVVSGAIAEQIGSELNASVIDLGDLHLRNMGRPVRVYALHPSKLPAKLLGEAPMGEEPRPSIAVLPFRMNLANPDESYFADGVVDDIIRGLAGLKELFVVSRGASLGFGGRHIDVREIGRQLGVRYILYGGIQRTMTTVRIVTELSDAESGEVIRSDLHEGDLGELFALQDRIAIRVVGQIAPQVRERELLRAMRKHPENLTAYDLALQALDLLYRMDYDSFSQARGLLEQAISHDPNFATAYAYVALWYVFRIGEIGSPDPEGDVAAGAKYAQAAVARGGDDAFALAVQGHVLSYLLHDFQKAKAVLERAVTAGPSSAMAWSMASATSGFLGDGPSAVRQGEQGVRLSPLDARSFWHEGLLGQAHYVNGDYEQALEWVRSALARNELIRFNHRLLIVTLNALGRTEEAAQAAQRLVQIQPGFRLSSYTARCPFRGAALETWLGHLRSAGLPD